ncbi:MAG: chromosome segregation protein SMC [Planctomycetaceae bacterium]|nr:chromosome segregation protein SMC [Planctomycetaceae bacterium]
MLKALELCGFKSFADKTRFEFPEGITVVVGPNGSGKSNIVDAIKWVLGEQSAKSLRGKEMADVIFKGSGGASATRRPANTAEATIFFENADRLLPIDTDEVLITRRVYRSGEAEYLINGNPCRLRDVRDLCRGTGVGTDAYSLIEQGKVDTLLQASARERRAIFEEAAGISRFKAKKVETQRRLERVEQNLTRLADIVEEVESRLRSVRNQASKARRYKEYNDRLKQLRTNVGLADWRRFTTQLDGLNHRLTETRGQLDELKTTLSHDESSQRHLDKQAEQVANGLQTAESSIADVRQRLAHHRSAAEHERERLADLEHEIQRYRRQWLAMTTRAGDLGDQVEEIEQNLASAESVDHEIRERLLSHEAELQTTTVELNTLRREVDQQREQHANLLRESGELGREISGLAAEIQSTQDTLERCQQQHTSLTDQLSVAFKELSEKEAAERRLEQQERENRQQLSTARQALQKREQRLSLTQQELIELQRRHAVASERASVLEDLERRKEGLSPGVKQILLDSQDCLVGPLTSVRGLVADLIRVDVGMAPLIDVALGELTQFIVVEGNSLAQAIAAGEIQPNGRVGLVDLGLPHRREGGSLPQLSHRAVLGRADSFIEVEPAIQPLVQQLLGSTWCVETLTDAIGFQQKHTGLRYVTRSGELLESDGRLLAGPRQSGLGLVSRRSELRSLQQEILQLDQTLQQTEHKLKHLKNEIGDAEELVENRSTAHSQVTAELTEARIQRQAASERHKTLAKQLETVQQEMVVSQEKLTVANQRHTERGDQQAKMNQRVGQLESDSHQHRQKIQQFDAQRQEESSKVTAVKVELAKSEQRLDDLRGQLIRFQEDQKERTRALDEIRTQLQQAQQRHCQASRLILDATTALAELYLADEQWQDQISTLRSERNQVQHQRGELEQRLRETRERQRQQEQLQHTAELEANQAQLERDGLAQRVQDDYGIELSKIENLPEESAEEQLEREEIDREIAELRRKISNIGAVNMAALEEIESLEQRHQTLAAQYQDLADAKESLARIIHKINADSRRLFTESLEIIRTNFQAMFRRVFGGGQADIVLEENVDILEAGIDIVATPPGKQSLGISLLSGGERALTAVTLLLAIFQYRPSPFCVLDEVDGPLDEANIGRFIDVLREFLEWTKFVVVTHSKKTMTAATTLYGVTMQESGVSKRVSVQFEDVTEDGHIRPEAIQRQSDPTHPPAPDDGSGDDERAA